MTSATNQFNQFGEELWEIANVFRDDALHATERLETFSLFLFLKLWDENASEEEELEGRALPDSKALVPSVYRFHRWAPDPDAYAIAHGFEDAIAFCRRMFDDLATSDSKHPNTRDVRRLFRDTVFRIRYASTIRALASRLLAVNVREVMSRGVGVEGERFDVFGRSYEYLLQQFGQNKEFAEYFTPRHIVDRMVQIIDPLIGEKIYDPACGTGGFIVRAFEWVTNQIARRRISTADKERLLRELKEKQLFGVEHVPLVFKLALMNMILHKDGSSQLENGDSLSNKAQELNKARFDVVLANPPFGPTKQERLAEFEYHIRLYEALFIQHIMNALAPGGRAAVVLKEGLLFDSKRLLRKICARLVDQFEVLAVISLPNGVFNPYSGAKTSIVVFRRPNTKTEERTSRVWFFNVESDGRDLGATRRPLADFATDGDLQELVQLWPYTWRHANTSVKAVLKSDTLADYEGPRSWWANVDEIRANDYNLTAGRYAPRRATTTAHERPEVLVNQLLELETEIQSDLQDLLTLVSVPKTPEGLRGAVRFAKSTDE
ncbi:MAG TPA: N-6 DNA methylase [Gemmatimonadaceae bacterium]|nr:N-6 DNA methylase [Gemmatimonadaceae bacterium]